MFDKYGTDKDALGYTPVYEVLFANNRHVRSLLEIGIGTMIAGVNSSMVGYGAPHYKPGASLRAWRDYFEGALICGLDPQPDTQFEEFNITTRLGDSTVTGLDAMFDVIIDDGSHSYADQIATLNNFWPCLNRAGVYVIEDLTSPEMSVHQDKIREIVGDAPFFFVTPKQYQMLVISKP